MTQADRTWKLPHHRLGCCLLVPLAGADRRTQREDRPLRLIGLSCAAASQLSSAAGSWSRSHHPATAGCESRGSPSGARRPISAAELGDAAAIGRRGAASDPGPAGHWSAPLPPGAGSGDPTWHPAGLTGIKNIIHASWGRACFRQA